MQRFIKFLKQLFSLRNLAPLLIILGAIVGSLGITPFGIKFATEQVVLGLLGFLAIDALVERLDILSKIEENVKKISDVTLSTVRSDQFLKGREDLPKVGQTIADAKKDIWIAGVTLDSIVGISFNLKEKMNQGCNIRILSINPYGKAIKFSSDYFDISLKGAPQRINGNLMNIISVLSKADRGSYEIRVIDNVFSTGYLIVDPELSTGWMNVQMYLYRTLVKIAPIFKLTKIDDPKWFSVFIGQYLDGWNNAIQYVPRKK